MTKSEGNRHFRSEDSVTNPDSGLVVPKHGRGRIKRGGNHGNKGGGRPRNEIRELLRKDFAATRQQLREKLDTGSLTFAEILRYAEFAGRFTVPVPKATYDKALIDELYSAVEKGIEGLDDAPEIMQRIKKRWHQILGKKLIDILA